MPERPAVLDACPEPLVGHETGSDGLVTLLVPRFRRGPLARWLQPRLRRPFMRLHLDEVGSFCWLRFDGRTQGSAVAAALHEAFGSRVEPAEERLTAFLRQLYRGDLIRYLTRA